MKKMRLILLAIALFVTAFAHAQKDGAKTEALTWYTDLMEAQNVSVATNKPIFGFFTGSDWCGWCKKLQRDVFAKPAFITWAKKEVVLLELDFPHYKALSPELQKQNAYLQKGFNVSAFPTVWFFTMDNQTDSSKYVITAIGSCGYPGGAENGKEEVKFLSNANAILNK